MKGIILAGTRLYPMIYYPLSVLMLAGIKDIQLHKISENLKNFWEMEVTGEYKIQPSPEAFIGNDSVCLILGDNIFSPMLKNSASIKDGAIVFGYQVKDPERFDKDKYRRKTN